MRSRAPLLAVLLITGYTTAAIVPCSAVATRAFDAEHATERPGTAHSLHAGHERHAAPDAEPAHTAHAARVASHSDGPEGSEAGCEWTAPCPCGCTGNSEAAGASSARLGFALARAVPELCSNPLATVVFDSAARLPDRPILGRDAIPI